MNFGSALSWKVGTIGAAVLAVIIGIFLFSANMENKRIISERDKLSIQINDPKTGYIARLTQARANTDALEAAIVSQNAAMQRQSTEAKLKIEDLRKELAAAQKRSLEAERRLAAFMATKPQGSSLEARVLDIDRRLLKDLNR
jgi:hypothetical protein